MKKIVVEHWLILIGLAAAGLSWATTVQASPFVTFEFAGYVTFGEIKSTLAGSDETLPLPGVPDSGSPITGFYSFDPTTPDRDDTNTPHGAYGKYFNAIRKFYVDFGGLEYTLDFTNGGFTDIRVEDNPNSYSHMPERDSYNALIREFSPPGMGILGPHINGFDPIAFDLYIFDWQDVDKPDLVNGDSLPVIPPDLDLVDNPYYGTSPYVGEKGSLRMTYQGDPSRQALIYGDLTSIKFVPESSTLVLMGIGFAAIYWRRKAFPLRCFYV